MALEALTWEQTCEAIATLYGTDAQTIANTLTANGVAVGDVEQAFKMLEGTPYEIWYNADGTVRSYNYVGTPETYLSGNAGDVSQLIDSNTQVSTKTAVKIPLNTTPGVADPTKVTFGAGMKQAGNFVLKEVLPAVAAASVGITLGKTIDSVLYNANPDFWDSRGWGSINPETWASITQDDDSLGAKVFNTVFKIDPQTKTSQAYLDQDAFAYLALMLQKAGFFATGTTYVDGEINNVAIEQPLYEYSEITLTTDYNKWVIQAPEGVKLTLVPSSSGPKFFTIIASTTDNNANKYIHEVDYRDGSIYKERDRALERYDAYYNGAHHYFYCSGFLYSDIISSSASISTIQYNLIPAIGIQYGTVCTGYALLAGEVHSSQPIPGVGTQMGATTPSLDNNDTVADVLSKLQSQYPELFNNAVTQDVVQPDGTVKTYTYIPVSQAQPTPNPTDGYDPQNQPISSTSTQTDPAVDPETATQAQLEYLIGLITDLVQPNMQNTGEGSTPPVVVPPGSAEALYKIYNPTESQINSFGAWLWSSNFVDQLLKMFNDPMQAIISLHKVFCSPSIGGTAEIKVGYLSSGVSSKYVNEQYVTVSCGSIQLNEDFRNVFDYPPFTEISLYLPFIGIVRLDVNDVMRSTITITYHIDVLTGSCLADVSIIRDMFGGILYQYAGDCSVHYPLSSGSYMGIVSALLGVTGTVASGGALAPMALGVASGVMGARSSVERSGGFSGNAGAMGSKKPYLIIQRPQTNTPSDFNKFLGKPSNEIVKISECTGFISCVEVHALNTICTESEMDEIITLLKSGILI